MKIYIDNDCKCFASPAEGLTEVETPFFDGKCAAFIEGYRFIPAEVTWTRSDGVEFVGEMITPWKDIAVLAAYQEQYEAMNAETSDSSGDLLAELDAAYTEGVNSV